MSAKFDPATGSVSVTCNNCGKPLVKTNEFGMFCEDDCFLEESKAGKETAKEMIDFIGKMFK